MALLKLRCAGIKMCPQCGCRARPGEVFACWMSGPPRRGVCVLDVRPAPERCLRVGCQARPGEMLGVAVCWSRCRWGIVKGS
eukprot:759424-Hanusia_phi.AAC.3